MICTKRNPEVLTFPSQMIIILDKFDLSFISKWIVYLDHDKNYFFAPFLTNMNYNFNSIRSNSIVATDIVEQYEIIVSRPAIKGRTTVCRPAEKGRKLIDIICNKKLAVYRDEAKYSFYYKDNNCEVILDHLRMRITLSHCDVQPKRQYGFHGFYKSLTYTWAKGPDFSWYYPNDYDIYIDKIRYIRKIWNELVLRVDHYMANEILDYIYINHSDIKDVEFMCPYYNAFSYDEYEPGRWLTTAKLMHDIETNPGPVFSKPVDYWALSYFATSWGAITWHWTTNPGVQFLLSAYALAGYMIKTYPKSPNRYFWYKFQDSMVFFIIMTLAVYFYVFLFLIPMFYSVPGGCHADPHQCVLVPYNYYSRLKLMHDIETNPGPVSRESHVNFLLRALPKFFLGNFEDEVKEFYIRFALVDDDELKTVFAYIGDRFLDKPQGLGDNIFTRHLPSFALPVPTLKHDIGEIKMAPGTSSLINDAVTKLTDSIKDINVNVGVKHEINFSSVPILSDLWQMINDPEKRLTGWIYTFVTVMLLKFAYPDNQTIRWMAMLVGVTGLVIVPFDRIKRYVTSWFMDAPQSSMENYFDLILEAFSLVMFGYKCDLSTLSSMGTFMVKINKWTDSFTSLMEKIKDWISRLVTAIGKCFGKEWSVKLSSFDYDLKEMGRILEDIYKKFEASNGRVTIEVADKVKQLDLKLMQLQTSLPVNKENTTVRHVLQSIAYRLEPIKSMVREAGLAKGGRVSPFVINIVGRPGTGKTFSTEYLTNALIVSQLDEAGCIEFKADPRRDLYTLNTNQKHYDTYRGQFCMNIPDMFTAKDAEGMESEATLFINMVGNNQMPLPAAALYLKGLLFFVSKLIVCCSNITHIHPNLLKSINTPEAVIRRLEGNTWYQIVKSQYRKIIPGEKACVTGFEDDPRFCGMLDQEKVNHLHPDVITMEPYEYVEFDIRTATPKDGGRTLNFYELTEHFIEKFEQHTQFEERKLYQVQDYNSDLIAKRLAKLKAQNNRPQGLDDDVDELFWDRFKDLENISKHDQLELAQACAVRSTVLYESIKEYYEVCRKSLSRPAFVYREQPDHPYSTLINGCSLKILGQIVEFDIKETSLISILLKAYNKETSFQQNLLKTVLFLYHNDMKIIRGLCAKADSWVSRNATVIDFCANFAIGFVISEIIILSIQWFVGLFKPTNKSQDTIVKDLKLDTNQASKDEVSERKFIDARLANGWSLTIRRTFLQDGKEVRTVREPSHVFMLSSEWGVTVWHTWQAMLDMNKSPNTILIEAGFCPWKVNGRKPIQWICFDDLQADLRDQEKDRVYIKFPSQMYAASNIIKYLPSRENPGFVEWVNSKANKDLLFVRKIGDNLSYEKVKMQGGWDVRYDVQTAFQDPVTGRVKTQGERYVINHDKAFTIDVNTIEGECGEVGFLIDNNKLRFASVDPVLQNPVIFYHHHSLKNTAGRGAGGVLWREDVEFIRRITFDISDPKERIDEDMSKLIKFISNKDTLQMQSADIIDVSPEYNEDFARHHPILGNLKPLGTNFASSIKRSEFYRVFERTRKPVKLFDHIKDGVFVKPMVEARQHYGGNTDVTINCRYADSIAHFIATKMINSSSIIKDTGVLTLDQVLLGDAPTHTTAVSRSTSAGFSLNYVKKELGIKGKGKYWIYGDGVDINTHTPEAKAIEKAVEIAEIRLRSGDRMMNIYADCLKDELRPPGKMPRLFCSADFVYLLQCKRYFGSWAGWIYENRIKNGIAIGINPVSNEWKAMYEMLKSMSESTFAGDFSKFDKYLLAVFIYACKTAYKKYYGNFDPGANKVRDLLFEDMVHSIHATNGKIDGELCTILYEWFHGNTSGNFLTAIINSIANLNMCLYAMVDILLRHRNICGGILYAKSVDITLIDEIWSKVCIMVYGDDNIMTIRELPQINFYTFQDAMSRIGLTYTDELKGTGGEVPPYRQLKDCNFIARGFREFYYKGRLHILADLRIYSILESVLWYKGKIDSDELLERVELLLQELSFRYNPETLSFDDYEKYAPLIIQACYETFGVRPMFDTWEMAFEAMLQRDSPLYSPLEPLSALDVHEIITKARARSALINTRSVCIDAFTQDLHSISLSTNIKEISSTPSKVCTAPSDIERKYVIGLDEPQSSQGDNISNKTIVTDVVCDEAKTTCFVESEGIVSTNYQTPSQTMNEIEIRYETIKDFLAKPKLLSSLQWPNATALNSTLYTTDVAPLLTSVTEWANKIVGFGLIRGTFVLRVTLNASPFQSGRLMLHYLPNYAQNIADDPGFAKRTNLNLLCKYQHPHVTLDARETTAILKVPYIAPSPFYDLKLQLYDWGRVFVDVVVPLASGASGQTFAELSVFGYWEDIELAAATIPQSSQKDKRVRRRGDIEETELSEKPVSSALSLISKSAKNMSAIPLLSPVMGPVSWATDLASQVASVFGWSKPRQNTEVGPMARQYARYLGTSDGPDISVPGGLITNNKIKLTSSYSLTDEDEMSMKYLLSIPNFRGFFQWTVGSTTGTTIFSAIMNPTLFYSILTNSYASHTVTYNQGAPLWYLANFFQYWRGSFKVKLSFVKTQYHSGRLMVTWTPGIITPNAPTPSNSLYSLREIIDIREQSEVELTLPYQLSAMYLDTHLNEPSGFFNVVVLNDLRAPETAAQSISMIVTIVAGDDFEFQVPTTCVGSGPIIYSPQSSQMDIVEAGIAETRKVQANTEPSELCIGESFQSLKQILNRSTQLFWTPATNPMVSNNEMALSPLYIPASTINTSSGALVACPLIGDAYSMIAPMYMYSRGSTKFTVVNNEPDQHINLYVAPGVFSREAYITSPFYFGKNFNGDAAPNNTIQVKSRWFQFTTPIPNDAGTGISTITIPFYNRFPVKRNLVTDGLIVGQAGRFDTPTATLGMAATGNFSATTMILRGMGDDFQLSFFLCAPPLFVSYV